ncbi:MAG TPA: acyl-CoA dehydrogenase family protein [Ilumatobacteraceae bacterium]|nr:acyl-CoA dehydrogenase family protein [Ilumatobacteraceae bacterium]
MSRTVNADQELFVDVTRRFIAEHCPTSTVRTWSAEPLGYDDQWWSRGADLGWTSALVPEALGGGSVSDSGLIDLTLIADAFGDAAAPGPLTSVNVVIDALARDGGADHLRRWIGSLLDGSVTAAWCAPELAADGRGFDLSVRATADGQDLLLNGVARQVLGGDGASLLLVPTRVDDADAHVLLDATATGLTIEPLQTLDLVQRVARLEFADVRVDRAAAIGTANSVERAFQVGLAIQLAETVGAMGKLFEITHEWLLDRYSFGRPLGSYQAIKHRFADARMWLEACRAAAAAAAHAVQEEAPIAAELVSVAKAFTAHRGPELAHECIQFHGGIGVTSEHDLHLYARRVIQNSALLGGMGEHRQRVAAILCGRMQ